MKYYGFGYNSMEMRHHFYVLIPSKKLADNYVSIYERYHWDEEGSQQISGDDKLKIEFPGYMWKLLADKVADEFNLRLKQDRLPRGRFTSKGVPLERLLGKELMALLWSLEKVAPEFVPVALRNWQGLQPEERWWLYTMTNAATGGINDSGRGWRMALRYIMCENPCSLTQPLPLKFEQTALSFGSLAV